MKKKERILPDLIKLPNKAFFTPSEVATYLGMSISTIYNWIDIGVIKGVVIMGRKSKRVPRQSIVNAVKPYDPDE